MQRYDAFIIRIERCSLVNVSVITCVAIIASIIMRSRIFATLQSSNKKTKQQ
jgi:hypothetical protein